MSTSTHAVEHILFTEFRQAPDVKTFDARNQSAVFLVAGEIGGDPLVATMQRYSDGLSDGQADPFYRVFALTTELEQLHTGAADKVAEAMEKSRAQELAELPRYKRLLRQIFF